MLHIKHNNLCIAHYFLYCFTLEQAIIHAEWSAVYPKAEAAFD